MRHGARHPGLRRANTLQAIREIAAAGLFAAEDCATLAEQYRFLRRVSLGLRLFGTRPSDTLELAGPNPARLAKTLEYPSRKDFLEDYRRRTAWVRALYDRVVRRSVGVFHCPGREAAEQGAAPDPAGM
jgi:glutamate-ammonia-ligase adenylyltransferase